MNNPKTTTSFRIGISVSMVILMLGVAISLNVFTTYSISNQNKVISEFNTPLSQEINQAYGIQEIQFYNFENAMKYKKLTDTTDYELSKNQFETHNTEFNYYVLKIKDLINSFQNTGLISDMTVFTDISGNINEIQSMHFQYEQKVNQVFGLQEKESIKNMDSTIMDFELQQNQINLKFMLLNDQIQKLTNNVESGIEESKQKSLTLQIIIMITAGIISLALCYFLNLINKDLVNEVIKKTKSLQKANKKLEQMNSLKDDFINVASHELKSPLHPIYGFVELAQNGDIGKDEALAGISKQARQIEEIANRILDISKIDNGILYLSFEKFDLRDLLLDITSFYKLNLNQKIRIETHLEEGLEIEADRIRISQVIRNLINNALKFTSAGIISISAYQELQKNTVHVIVRDSGIGIHPEVMPYLFNKFATKGIEKESGNGLGLYLCKGIINAHGGKIFGYNNAGSGATMEFTIPMKTSNVKSNKKMPNFVCSE